MSRPLCPTCNGTLKRMSTGGEVPCTNCDNGYMRGIDDPTPEELRIDRLTKELAAARKLLAGCEGAFTLLLQGPALPRGTLLALRDKVREFAIGSTP